MPQKSLKTKSSTLTSTSDLLITSDWDNSDVSPCLDRLYVPHDRYRGQGLQCFGKGVMIRGRTSSGVCFRFSGLSASAGRATTSYLRMATLGARAVSIVSKMLVAVSISKATVDPPFLKNRWNIWDGFHKEVIRSPQYLSLKLKLSRFVALSLWTPTPFATASGALCAQYYRCF